MHFYKVTLVTGKRNSHCILRVNALLQPIANTRPAWLPLKSYCRLWMIRPIKERNLIRNLSRRNSLIISCNVNNHGSICYQLMINALISPLLGPQRQSFSMMQVTLSLICTLLASDTLGSSALSNQSCSVIAVMG